MVGGKQTSVSFLIPRMKRETAPIILGILGSLVILFADIRRRRISMAGLRRRLPTSEILDLLPPAATAGVAVALGTTLYSPIFSTSVPLKSPTTLGMILSLIFFAVLWGEGRKQIQFQRPFGLLLAEWLVFAGAAAIALTLLSQPTGQRHFGPFAYLALASLVAGFALIGLVVPPFAKKYEGLRILDRVAAENQFTQPEYTAPSRECPHPELWRMLDSQTTEVEVLEFLKALVTTTKPSLVVETGTFLGHGTMKLAEGLKENGFGKVITIEFDPAIRARALENFAASGLAPWIESRLESSLDTQIEGTIDLLYSDSHLANREAEIRRLLPQLDPQGLLIIHDASSQFQIVREAALRLEAEGLISAVLLSTPRGVVVAQRRQGRQ